MQKITITLVQTDAGDVLVTPCCEPPISWANRMTSKVEKVAKAMLDVAFVEFGVRMDEGAIELSQAAREARELKEAAR